MPKEARAIGGSPKRTLHRGEIELELKYLNYF